MDTYIVERNEDINTVAENMIQLTSDSGDKVGTSFNGVIIVVRPGDNIEFIAESYLRQKDGNMPVDDRILDIVEYEQFQKELNQARDNRIEFVEKIIALAPPISLRNRDFWDNVAQFNKCNVVNTSLVEYTERWARLMEAHLSVGIDISENAGMCSQVADFDNKIFGNHWMTWSAALLSRTWQYGEELWSWYIRKFPDEANTSVWFYGE